MDGFPLKHLSWVKSCAVLEALEMHFPGPSKSISQFTLLCVSACLQGFLLKEPDMGIRTKKLLIPSFQELRGTRGIISNAVILKSCCMYFVASKSVPREWVKMQIPRPHPQRLCRSGVGLGNLQFSQTPRVILW